MFIYAKIGTMSLCRVTLHGNKKDVKTKERIKFKYDGDPKYHKGIVEYINKDGIVFIALL